MAGSPIKHERNRLVREAILKALSEGGMRPEDRLVPMAKKFIEKAEAGDVPSFKEIADRLDGKPAQQVQLQGDPDSPLETKMEVRLVRPTSDASS